MISVKNLTKKYSSKIILSNISFQVEEGSVFGVMGKNGSGKTTLIESILQKNDYEGQILLSQRLIRENKVINYNNLYFVNDSPHSYNYLTGLEYIYFVLQIKNRALPTNDRIFKVLDLFGIEEDQANDLMITYSFGMKRKIILALGFLVKPDLMILDEPTIGLDVPSVITLKKMILSASKQGQTFIISSHEPAVMSELCDALLILHGTKSVYCNMEFKDETRDLNQLYMELICSDLDQKITSALTQDF